MNSDEEILTALSVDVERYNLNEDEMKRIVFLLRKTVRPIMSVVKNNSISELQSIVLKQLGISEETTQKIVHPFVEIDESLGVPSKPLYYLSPANADVVSKREFFEFQDKMINALNQTLLSTENSEESKMSLHEEIQPQKNFELQKSTPVTPVNVPEEFQIIFAPKEPDRGISYFGKKIDFQVTGGRTVFLMQDLQSAKIYVLDVVLKGNIHLGLAKKSSFPELHSTYVFSQNGTCMLWEDGIYTGTTSCIGGLCNWESNVDVVTSVRLELNQTTHTLCFFVEKHQISHCVINVPTNVYFTISNKSGTGWCRVLCLSSTLTPLATMGSTCRRHPWKD